MTVNRRISVAPMMDWTDRHDRYFLRQISRHALLYTEMVTTGAIIHGGADRHLRYNTAEHPVALQLGGSNPDDLARACEIANDYAYDEINLNCGCPSDRVQNGAFGACLMATPDVVANCVKAMIATSNASVTVKNRIGIDDQEDYPSLKRFVETVADAGCRTFIVHARKAWLNGLSPKENREVPPLKYELVYQLKQELPELEILINGGIKTLDETEEHLKQVDGVMIGREAYQNPYVLSDVDRRFYGDDTKPLSRHQVAEAMLPYIDEHLKSNNGTLGHVTRHMLGLFQQMRGAKQWRRYLSENAHRKGAGVDTVREALALVSKEDAEVLSA
ncbi:tRNA-U16,U17-dihydrouridine synthase [Thalassospira xiamenensis M-5 = DSM 17429]|uniref:tRNA-dihydrouridine(20/20a) synthase n=1 Tax=Thalassospira xiamenensis M-5 = DSM 17429 TaxID=1123366 RepID=A0AB72UCK5_9PROT|nr:tRNA dihydrouridine(20/20a) synthase DusA [Thalassospira xiamenensis]AJD51893.1 TIM-barrel protein, yjbN family [Thalassospira xiamenensis M-5 = DSM 17429]SIS98628.1 tRNA-U16,U17-dihydrouridine synthase [Thalassospira xiamenensis M-5 = DSM 17429]